MKHIHFIGICGVAMSALAIAFQQKGYRVTGSDAGFYPPVSTNLKKHKIAFYPGWHPEKMSAKGHPDLVVVGNVAGSNNPEWLSLQVNDIPYLSYPEAIAEYFLGKNSIVAAGTYGKTTTSTLLSWIFRSANMDPSYMFGAIPVNDFPSAALSDIHEWSILEGDEYKTSGWDTRPKFALYNPTHLLLTSVSWDHADVYPTEKSYLETFEQLVASVPKTGLIVACEDGPNVPQTLKHAHSKLILYGTGKHTDYRYQDVQQTEKGLYFNILHKNETFHVKTPILGEYNAENITGCFALAHQAGIAPEVIVQSIQTFKGIKRRLEKRLSAKITVIDDIAHSPTKATSLLQTLKKIYKGKLFVVFEPNTGNRRSESIPQYDHAFARADEIIIPRLSKLKIDPQQKVPPMDGETLAQVIGKTHAHVEYIEDDEVLVTTLLKKAQPGDVIAFLGSHGFRGMIEKTVHELHALI